MGRTTMSAKFVVLLLTVAAASARADGDYETMMNMKDEQPHDDLTPFQRACHELVMNPSDDYLGLGEADRVDPTPTTPPKKGSQLAEVADVDIHKDGTFKYILSRLDFESASKNVVRASPDFDLHVDNFEALRREVAVHGPASTIDKA